MPKRNPFDRLRKAGTEEEVQLPPAASQAKRPRGWEKAHPATAYRIPIELREDVKALARELGVATDDVARALLEHGLAAYRAGTLRLQAHPATSKLTLFPDDPRKTERGRK